MSVSTISSNPILNSAAFQRIQSKETTNDPAAEALLKSDKQAAVQSDQDQSQDDNVSLNAGLQALRAEQTKSARPAISAHEAERTANSLKQMMSNNPQQAMQAFGIPDSRMVQSLLSVT